MKIIWLKLSIRKLKRKRYNAVLDISVNFPKEANRVNRIEDVNPDYFKRVDAEIKAKEKLVGILRRRSLNNFHTLSSMAHL